MNKKRLLTIPAGFILLGILALLLYRIPAVNRRLSWRLDIAATYLRGVVNPVSGLPTAVSQNPLAEDSLPTPAITIITTTPLPATPEDTPVKPSPTPLPTFTPTPIPDAVHLPHPSREKQDWNNCGPATLAMYLRFYGWKGTQFDISDLIKPARNDRNVNVEELVYYTRNNTGWLKTIYRVGGHIEQVKRLVAAGIPVMAEMSFYFDGPYWPHDDLWAAHYILVVGYDDTTGAFDVVDSYRDTKHSFPYEKFNAYWQSFNRVYIVAYLPDQEEAVRTILGEDWDETRNRERALETAQKEAEKDPKNAFAWFNVGTNLVYFGKYSEAAKAYDKARTIGLPQRMLRYQFGPFLAAFHSGNIDDLLTLTKYALQRTPNSEEALLWHGWALYRKGDIAGAIDDFTHALEVKPHYPDAEYALRFVQGK